MAIRSLPQHIVAIQACFLLHGVLLAEGAIAAQCLPGSVTGHWGSVETLPSGVYPTDVAYRTLALNWRVVDAYGNPLPNTRMYFCLAAANDPLAGGHAHSPGQQPLGQLLFETAVTPANGDYLHNVYTVPMFAGEVMLNIDCDGCPDLDEQPIVIRVPQLVQFAFSGNEVAVSNCPASSHAGCYFATQELADQVHGLSASYAAYVVALGPALGGALPARLPINDMSLQWGGGFDYLNNWGRPHASHAGGRDVDIDISQNHPIAPRLLRMALSDFPRLVPIREIGVTNHFHLRLK